MWSYARITNTSSGNDRSTTTININENKRSERIITLKDLFPDDYKISDIVLNYAKMFKGIDYAIALIRLLVIATKLLLLD